MNQNSIIFQNESNYMKKIAICFLFALAVAGVHSCNSNKISCPTYANSLPEKKKKTKPGAQKPDIPKYTKPKSDVMPRKK